MNYRQRLTALAALWVALEGLFITPLAAVDWSKVAPVGIHSTISDRYTGLWQFADAYKQADAEWRDSYENNYSIKLDGKMQFDSDGWPTALPADGSVPRSILFTHNTADSDENHRALPGKIHGAYPLGRYALTWEGTGRVELHCITASQCQPVGELQTFPGQGRDGGALYRQEYEISGTDRWGLEVRFLPHPSNPGNPNVTIRHVSLWMPDPKDSGKTLEYAPGEGGPIWHPLFIERFKPFGYVRNMSWESINNSVQRSWADRKSPTDHTQTAVDPWSVSRPTMAYEYQVDFCNSISAGIWVCIPHLADDDYVRRLAELLRDGTHSPWRNDPDAPVPNFSGLKPDSLIFIEFSNETWNGGFGQARSAFTAGERSGQIFEIFNTVFTGQEDRLVRVVSGWTDRPSEAADKLRAALTKTDRVDAIAVTTYFGNSYNLTADNETTFNDLRKQFMPGGTVHSGWLAHQNLIDSANRDQGLNMRLLAYESNWHVTKTAGAALFDFARSQYKYDLTREMQRQFIDVIGAASNCAFHMGYPFSKEGFTWGILEFMDQDLAAAPTYRAFVDYIVEKGWGSLRIDRTLPLGRRGQPYHAAIKAVRGIEPYAFTLLSGLLPPGLSLGADGTLSGTVEAGASGDFTFSVEVTDSNPEAPSTVAETLTLLVPPDTTPVILTTVMPGTSLDGAFNLTLQATGGNPPFTWEQVDGHLPPGLHFSSAGLLSGVTTVAGTYVFTVRLTDGDLGVDLPTDWDEQQYSMTVSAAAAFELLLADFSSTPPTGNTFTMGTTALNTLYRWGNNVSAAAAGGNPDSYIKFGGPNNCVWLAVPAPPEGGIYTVSLDHKIISTAGSNKHGCEIYGVKTGGSLGNLGTPSFEAVTLNTATKLYGNLLSLGTTWSTCTVSTIDLALDPEFKALVIRVYNDDISNTPGQGVDNLRVSAKGIIDPVPEYFRLGTSFGNDDQTYSGTWFDTFTVPGLPWIYHWQLGWLCGAGDSVGWLYGQDLGGSWLWTGPVVYPWLYDTTAGEWQYYLRGTVNPRWFFRLATGEWIQR